MRRISSRSTLGGLMLVLLISAQASAAVTWGTATTASASHGFNTGRALATTKAGSTTHVHQVYVNNYPGGTLAGDGGGAPHEAIMYQRRTAAGGASGSAKRLNSTSQHGNASAVAAAGSNVYVVWSHLAKYNYTPSDARTLQFRSNADHGSGAWSAVKNLTTSGHIDTPSIAAAGTYVYIGYTDADTGVVHLLISSDKGAHFHDSGLSMAAVTSDNGFGYWGSTSVAAAGSNVAMAWLSGDRFTASAWTSTDRAGSKSNFTLASGDAAGGPRVAALGNRIAFAIATPGTIRAKIWNNGALGGDLSAASFGPTMTLKRSYTVDVALGGSAGIGLAWNACRIANCSSTDSPAKGQDMIWRESTDNGAHWKSAVTLQSSTGTSTAGKLRRANAYASAVFLSATKRIVVFDSFNGSYSKGLMLLRVGNGPA